MQHTIIDPFELRARALPVPETQLPSVIIEPDPPAQPMVAIEKPPVEKPAARVPRAEAWARVRCWCSEE